MTVDIIIIIHKLKYKAYFSKSNFIPVNNSRKKPNIVSIIGRSELPAVVAFRFNTTKKGSCFSSKHGAYDDMDLATTAISGDNWVGERRDLGFERGRRHGWL